MTRVLALLVLLAPLGALAVQAQEPPPLTSASAVWTTDGKVELKLTYDGSACEAPGEAQVSASDSDEAVDAVTIPTTATAETCTMQIVAVEFSGTIAVEPRTLRLAVTVLDTDGQPKAAGSVEIARPAAS